MLFPANHNQKRTICILFVLALVAAPPGDAAAVENSDCLLCHDTIDQAKFSRSAHGGLNCGDCHADLSPVTDFPHEPPLKPVDCGTCHTPEQEQFRDSLHGKALGQGDPLAPRCQHCHGSHDILPVKDKDSAVAPLRIPFVCGSCHSEGTAVQRQRNIHQDHILENYSESIHGEGIFKKGLSVGATCSSCHNAHLILPHTDPRSSISKQNVVNTCLKCHAQIEAVHRKVIRGELWEKKPDMIPVCVECHQPHKVSKVFYDQGVADKDCLLCHSQPGIRSSSDGRSLSVNAGELKSSRHPKVSCAQCHTGVTPSKVRACETIAEKVNCAVCHEDEVAQYGKSIHGKLVRENDPNAPACLDCHGAHRVLGQKEAASPTYPTNVPALCGRCHRESGQAALRYKGSEHEITQHYVESIHGKGLLKSGLVVTAMCTSCHTAHRELPAADPESSVNRRNIAATCAQCHKGVYEQYVTSVHYAGGDARKSERLPACSGCHSAHTIKRTDLDQFKFDVMNICGKCHEEYAKTYFGTFHGKVSKLGYAKSAKCYDCHGSHDILPPGNPGSRLSRKNIIGTCQKCHPGAPRRFAGYLTHATHHNPRKYPWIFGTFWAMTGLLVFTFVLFGVHTLLWLPKSLQMRRAHPPRAYDPGKKQYVRFNLLHRVLHGIMIVSFLTLTTTGMTLKFSYAPWAVFISRLLGGFAVTGFLHRAAAVTLLSIFTMHVVHLATKKRREAGGWKALLTGPNTMLPTKKDLREVSQTLLWYLGKAERPRYGRWTYWEKFDYFAVFWGVAVIGLSGLMLWFPEFFTRFLPGWVINVATIIHSDEALLAAGFIFTIHFFNTHFRPEKFPMDTVIFTGRVPVEELRRERPAEYEEMVERKELEKNLALPLRPAAVRALRVFGWCALVIGLGLVVCIIYTMVFAYK